MGLAPQEDVRQWNMLELFEERLALRACPDAAARWTSSEILERGLHRAQRVRQADRDCDPSPASDWVKNAGRWRGHE